jgi:hypothetical protein
MSIENLDNLFPWLSPLSEEFRADSDFLRTECARLQKEIDIFYLLIDQVQAELDVLFLFA